MENVKIRVEEHQKFLSYKISDRICIWEDLDEPQDFPLLQFDLDFLKPEIV